ncbi:MAG: VOC family protein [Alphaproteobacteria bacterium]|nr:VOC family protein [Alphaproteobacteria bacterium]
MAKNLVTVDWFEIPVGDLERASNFYSAVLDADLVPMEVPEGKMKAFQNGEMPVGALVENPHNKPSATGSLVYFHSDDIDATLGQVTGAGGTVAVPKTSIGPYGHIAQFVDTEGNRVALHSM